MFTGIITHLGEISKLTFNEKNDLLLEISTAQKITRDLALGCSIACNGICLTLVSKKISEEKTSLTFQASKETCDKTTIGTWKVGQIINLEFALRVGDELGGHMVLGHVDACAKITEISKVKDSQKFTFVAPKELMPFIAKKGSVTLDGISLTVNEVKKNCFSINAISHTIENTSLKNAKVEDLVNLEIDALARYVKNFLQK
jgi:riboflavin synthase